jgi:hypothetical protein
MENSGAALETMEQPWKLWSSFRSFGAALETLEEISKL